MSIFPRLDIEILRLDLANGRRRATASGGDQRRAAVAGNILVQLMLWCLFNGFLNILVNNYKVLKFDVMAVRNQLIGCLGAPGPN